MEWLILGGVLKGLFLFGLWASRHVYASVQTLADTRWLCDLLEEKVPDPLDRLSLLDDFGAVGFDAHWRERFWGRDPTKIYPQRLREIIDPLRYTLIERRQ